VSGARGGRQLGALLPAVLLGALVLLLFSPAREFAFLNFDDNEYITGNPAVSGGLTREGVRWAFSAPRFDYWIPLTWLSHMLDVDLHGLDPAGHHLTGILLHAANAAILYLLLATLTGARWRSLLAAALFAAHPLRVESVAWVTERKDVLSTFFGLLALLAYARHARRPAGRAMLLAAALLACSLMAKPMLVTFPLLALLLDLWPLGRIGIPAGGAPRGPGAGRRRALLAEKAPLFAVAFAAGIVVLFTQQALYTVVKVPLAQRAAVAFVSPVDYLAKTLWPAALAVVYPPRGLPVPAGALLLAAATLGGGTALALATLRRRPFVVVGWFWFLVALLPVGGFFQAGMIALADRFTYLPHVGLAVALSWAAGDLASASRVRRVALVAGCAAVVGLLAAGTWRQLPWWRDSRTLFARAVEVTSDNAVAHNNLAAALADAGDTGGAVRVLREALRFAPENPVIRNNLGVILLRGGDPAAAEAQLRRAREADPRREVTLLNLGMALAAQGKFAEAREVLGAAAREHPGSAASRAALGAVLLGEGDAAGAARELAEAVRLDPAAAEARNNLGAALAALGRAEEALASYRDALRIRPAYAGARYNLALALSRSGRPEEAVPEFERALSLLAGGPAPTGAEAGSAGRGKGGAAIALVVPSSGPDPARVAADLAGAHNDVGVSLVSRGRIEEAMRSYREAVRLVPGNAAAHNNLGNALAQAGRPGEAVEMYRAAIARDPGFAAAYHNLALALDGLGRAAEAAAARGRARELERPP
jgi:Flp pilus assembly protein TadD